MQGAWRQWEGTSRAPKKMLKPCVVCDTRTSRGWHQQAARESVSVVWKHGVGTPNTDAKHERRKKRRNSSTTNVVAHNLLQSVQSASRAHGVVGHHRRSTMGLAYCYRYFHPTRWITHCMAFPCPTADSLTPMDQLLSFDVSLIIPKLYKLWYTWLFPRQPRTYAGLTPIVTYIGMCA